VALPIIFIPKVLTKKFRQTLRHALLAVNLSELNINHGSKKTPPPTKRCRPAVIMAGGGPDHRQNTRQQSRTASRLIDQLVSLKGDFDHRIEQQVAQQWENTSQVQISRGQQQLLKVQQSLQQLADKVQQLNEQVRTRPNEQIPDEIRQRLFELSNRIEQSQRQVNDMVRRYRWAENIVAQLSGGVCLIQGQYIFVDPQTDLPLRFSNSQRESTAGQINYGQYDAEIFQPVSVTGKGETLKITYSATGFLVDPKGYILTNKHVTTPWQVARDYRHVLEAGYQGRLRMFRAFFADQPEPFDLKLIAESETEDVALLSCEIGSANIPALPCEEDPRQLKAGQSVVILGYPTGFEALLARLGHDELDEITGDKDVPIDKLALTLARRGLIQPIGALRFWAVTARWSGSTRPYYADFPAPTLVSQ